MVQDVRGPAADREPEPGGGPEAWPLGPASLAFLARLGACAERLRAMDLDPALLAAEAAEPGRRGDP